MLVVALIAKKVMPAVRHLQVLAWSIFTRTILTMKRWAADTVWQVGRGLSMHEALGSNPSTTKTTTKIKTKTLSLRSKYDRSPSPALPKGLANMT